MLKKALFCMAFIAISAPLSLFAESPLSEKTPSVYVVKKGDCLWNISKHIWGDGRKWTLLYVANQDKIKDPNLIYPRQKLTVPTSLTAEQLKETQDLAHPKLASKTDASGTSNVNHGVSPQAITPHKSKHAQPAPVEPAAASSSAVTENPAPAAPANPSGHPILWAVLIAGLVLGFIVVWRMKKAPPISQAPKPLSSYSPPAEPVKPSPLSVSPVKPAEPAQASQGPSALPVVGSAADVYVRQGLYEEAAKIYRGILEKEPNNVEIGKKLIDVENKMKLKAGNAAAAQEPPAVSPSEPPMRSATITSISQPSAQTPPQTDNPATPSKPTANQPPSGENQSSNPNPQPPQNP
jgi:hypothetical protein